MTLKRWLPNECDLSLMITNTQNIRRNAKNDKFIEQWALT